MEAKQAILDMVIKKDQTFLLMLTLIEKMLVTNDENSFEKDWIDYQKKSQLFFSLREQINKAAKEAGLDLTKLNLNNSQKYTERVDRWKILTNQLLKKLQNRRDKIKKQLLEIQIASSYGNIKRSKQSNIFSG